MINRPTREIKAYGIRTNLYVTQSGLQKQNVILGWITSTVAIQKLKEHENKEAFIAQQTQEFEKMLTRLIDEY
jgi:hypothetical protein